MDSILTQGLLRIIANKIEAEPMEYTAYGDMLSVAKEVMRINRNEAVDWLRWLNERCAEIIPCVAGKDLVLARKYMSLHKQVLLANAPEDFDSFLLYIEWNRAPEKKFYAPRRKILKQVVDALQDLADDLSLIHI